MTKTFLLALILLLSGCLVSTKQKQYPTDVTFNDVTCEIFVSGNIDNKVTSLFQQLLQKTSQVNNCKEITVTLSSLGGNVYPAMTLGNIIRSNKFNTKVKENEICGSACVLVYMSGVNRYMSRNINTKIGIHQMISIESGKENCIDINDNTALASNYKSYLKKMISNKANDFYLNTIQAVNCKSVKFFNAKELQSQEIVTVSY